MTKSGLVATTPTFCSKSQGIEKDLVKVSQGVQKSFKKVLLSFVVQFFNVPQLPGLQRSPHSGVALAPHPCDWSEGSTPQATHQHEQVLQRRTMRRRWSI